MVKGTEEIFDYISVFWVQAIQAVWLHSTLSGCLGVHSHRWGFNGGIKVQFWHLEHRVDESYLVTAIWSTESKPLEQNINLMSFHISSSAILSL